MADGPKGYADLADLPEDERIAVIAHHVRDHGLTVAVAVDNDPGKPERYTRKLRKAGCLVEQLPGMVRGTVTLRVEPINVN